MAGKLKDEGWSAVTLFKTVQALDAEGYLMVTGIVSTGKTYARKMGVSRQAVSKWESAGAVPDLQRILQMSELFGVSTDYLLKDEMKAENITYHESTESYAEPLKKVTMENANEFLDMKKMDPK